MKSINLNEASKLNPGKNAIKASLLGSKSAATLVKTAQGALKQWPELDREKKKAVYAKLGDLKKVAKQNMSKEIGKVKPEQKKAAAEKATQMHASFTAAIKKRENSNEAGPDISKLEKQRDELKDWLVGAQDEFEKSIEGKSDDEAEKIGEKMMATATKKAEEYNKILQQIEDANKSNEAYSCLTEWFQILLEFDADKTVDALGDKVKDVVSGGNDGSSESDGESDEDKEAAIDDKYEKMEEDLTQQLIDLDMEIEDLKDKAESDREEAQDYYKSAQDMKADKEDPADIEYQMDNYREYMKDSNAAKEKVSELKSEYAKIEKEIEKVKKEYTNALKALKENTGGRLILKYHQFINERFGS